MNLKVRLAALYSLSVLIILLVSGISIYVLNENFRKEEFNKRLSLEAEESNLLLASVARATPGIIDELNKSAANSLPHESLIVFDSTYKVVYKSLHYPVRKFPMSFFEIAKSGGQHNFNIKDAQAVLIYRHLKGKSAYVLASATDIFGKRKNENLKVILVFSACVGIMFSGLTAFFYVKQAMKPLEKLKDQIEKINEANLKDRLVINRNNDEVTQIATKFNAMLDRLQEAFEQRKNFVHHASHELRTPLANMLSQTESALGKKLSPEDYRATLFSLKEEQQDLIDLTNSLLTLSRYEKIDPNVRWPRMRIDEVVYQTVEFIHLLWPNAVVNIDFETIPEDEDCLSFEGNESLIRSAVQNLIKNAIQYSENQKVSVTIDAHKEGITLHFDNKGRLLPAAERESLFIPFFRGENAQNKKGYGLGLSIVKRIITVHSGTIRYRAIKPDINRFTLFLPNI